MKKIALFSDGTGNSSSNPQKTNVWRAYKALDIAPGHNQIAFYDNGVGTSSFTPTAILGLAFGWGLARNVRQLYGFLCRTYEEGDEIYGFGFSRGAFTIRVTMAFIASQGIVDRRVAKDDRDLDRLIVAAYRRYRQKQFTPSLLSFIFRPVRDIISNAWGTVTGEKPYDPEKNIRHVDRDTDKPLIKFLGVWDTVDAYGLPIDELTRAWDKVVWPLTAKDRNLSPRVARACHALALDEQRKSFEPMLWNEHGKNDPRATQVWFSGVHANVGGSYPDDSMALVAMNWILGESEKDDGLTFVKQVRDQYRELANVCGPLYDSRGGVGNLYRYEPRDLKRLCREERPGLANWIKSKRGKPGAILNEVDIVKPKIHHSVFQRISQSGDGYAPINIPDDYAVLQENGDVVDVRNPGQATLAEDANQAKDRKARQVYAWNKVWARKALYAITVLALIAFVVYPYVNIPNVREKAHVVVRFVETIFGTFSYALRSVPELVGKIPGLGFTEAWAHRYAEFPIVFTLGILFIAALLVVSWKVNAALRNEMRTNWYLLTNSNDQPPADVSALRKIAGRFLDSDFYRNRIRRLTSIGLQTGAVVLFLVILVLIASRVVLTVVDGFGGVCGEIPHVQNADFGKEFTFDPKEACFATGLTLKPGNTYSIKLTVENWKDKNIEADVTGWRDAPAYMSLFVPLRRHLLVDWYRPMARIGDKRFDRHPLRLAKPPEGDAPVETLTVNITPRQKGQLYLYLNDAVFFWPGLIKEYYENNKGSAKVIVNEVTKSHD